MARQSGTDDPETLAFDAWIKCLTTRKSPDRNTAGTNAANTAATAPSATLVHETLALRAEARVCDRALVASVQWKGKPALLRLVNLDTFDNVWIGATNSLADLELRLYVRSTTSAAEAQVLEVVAFEDDKNIAEGRLRAKVQLPCLPHLAIQPLNLLDGSHEWWIAPNKHACMSSGPALKQTGASIPHGADRVAPSNAPGPAAPSTQQRRRRRDEQTTSAHDASSSGGALCQPPPRRPRIQRECTDVVQQEHSVDQPAFGAAAALGSAVQQLVIPPHAALARDSYQNLLAKLEPLARSDAGICRAKIEINFDVRRGNAASSVEGGYWALLRDARWLTVHSALQEYNLELERRDPVAPSVTFDTYSPPGWTPDNEGDVYLRDVLGLHSTGSTQVLLAKVWNDEDPVNYALEIFVKEQVQLYEPVPGWNGDTKGGDSAEHFKASSDAFKQFAVAIGAHFKSAMLKLDGVRVAFPCSRYTARGTLSVSATAHDWVVADPNHCADPTLPWVACKIKGDSMADERPLRKSDFLDNFQVFVESGARGEETRKTVKGVTFLHSCGLDMSSSANRGAYFIHARQHLVCELSLGRNVPPLQSVDVLVRGRYSGLKQE